MTYFKDEVTEFCKSSWFYITQMVSDVLGGEQRSSRTHALDYWVCKVSILIPYSGSNMIDSKKANLITIELIANSIIINNIYNINQPNTESSLTLCPS